MPITSATQSFTSALRLKLGCIISMVAPKIDAPIKTGRRPMRPVRDNGKAKAAKAMMCTILSLPPGAGSGWSRGQSITTVRISVTINVRGMSRYLRIHWDVSGTPNNGKLRPRMAWFVTNYKFTLYQGLVGLNLP